MYTTLPRLKKTSGQTSKVWFNFLRKERIKIAKQKDFQDLLKDNTAEIKGETYEDFDTPDEDLHKSIRLAAESFLKQEETIARLTKQIDSRDSQSKKLLAPVEVKGFVRQALPQVTSIDSALQMVNHLIAVDQQNPTGWFNAITKNQSKNKLQLIQALIEIGLESEA